MTTKYEVITKNITTKHKDYKTVTRSITTKYEVITTSGTQKTTLRL